LREALKYIDAERLWIAPDCGLGYLPKELAEQKLKNMCEAARIITNELNSGSVPN
jgi:5-methyltetrahydropteroyltriglutamate--homocysteine methyltransferase